MAAQDLLRNKVAETPTIYAYEHIGYPSHKGWLKVGYTTRDVETRVKEQNQTGNIQYRIVLKRPAMRKDGSSFTDKLIHRILRKDHIRNPEGEWFVCDIKKVEQAVATAVAGKDKMIDRIYDFSMRPEQRRAVDKTSAYFSGTVIGLWDTAIDTAVSNENRSFGSFQSPQDDRMHQPKTDCHSERSEESIHPWERLQAGDTVVHKSFGPGEILSIDEKYLIVGFSDRESKFLYPGAFEKGYLLLNK